MHDKVYNRRVASATPLPPPALEMDTQDARVSFIRSIAKLKLLKFDTLSISSVLRIRKVESVEYRIFCSHFVKL